MPPYSFPSSGFRPQARGPGMPGPYIQSWKKVSTIAKHIQTQSEWEQTMARRVMEQLRGELYLDQRYLTAALGALPAAPRESGGSFATDGGALYYPTAWLLDTYRRNRRYLPRAYLHSLFHCIFQGHLFCIFSYPRCIFRVIL